MKKIVKLSILFALAGAGCQKAQFADSRANSADQLAAKNAKLNTLVTYSVIDNGVTWNTTAGTPIKAQGGNIFRDGTTYHWFGHDFTGGTGFKAVNHYTSTDLVSWTDQGPAFSAASYSPAIPVAGGTFPFDGRFLGRPFVIKKAANNFVMVVSINTGNANARNTYTFLTATNVNGPWTYDASKNVFTLPDVNGVACSMGDLGAFYDQSNGTAYLVYTFDGGIKTAENTHYGIRKLNDDFTAPLLTNDAFVQFDKQGSQSDPGGGGREACAIFKRGSTYYLTSSGTSGWKPSVSWYRTASALPSPGTTAATWSALHPMPTNPASTNSFNTQHDQIVGLGNDLFMYVGDRWPDGGGGPGSTGAWPARNAWYPLSWAPSTIPGEAPVPTINAPNFSTNGGDWKVDLSTGTWLAN